MKNIKIEDDTSMASVLKIIENSLMNDHSKDKASKRRVLRLRVIESIQRIRHSHAVRDLEDLYGE